jgi:hypothetical protein
MSYARPTALTCGLAAVLALAAPTARAQPPGGGEEKSARQKLRDRLIDLRAEVEVLQLEHDADRADLRASLKTVRKLQREGVEGLNKDVVKAIKETVEMFQTARNIASDDDLARLLKRLEQQAKAQNGVSALDRYIREKGLKNVDPNEVGRLMVEGELAVRVEKGLKEVDRKKARFAETTRQLQAKKLDLEDAEQRYQDSR